MMTVAVLLMAIVGVLLLVVLVTGRAVSAGSKWDREDR